MHIHVKSFQLLIVFVFFICSFSYGQESCSKDSKEVDNVNEKKDNDEDSKEKEEPPNQKEVTSTSEQKVNVLCLSARTVRDELGVNILSQQLVGESFDVQQTTSFNINEVFAEVQKMNPDVVCIVVVAPFAISHSLHLCTKLHQRFPKLSIFIGLWGFSEVDPEINMKLTTAGATKVVFSLTQALEILQEMQLSKKLAYKDEEVKEV